MFQLYRNINPTLLLALNIKADGLQLKLKGLLEKHQVTNYFVFDMNVPDGLVYIQNDFSVFTRQSEYEKQPAFYNEAQGIWLDEFHSHWISKKIIENHINNKKKICIVSPELHNRTYQKEWEDYKNIEKELGCKDIMICTDYLEEARRFFYG